MSGYLPFKAHSRICGLAGSMPMAAGFVLCCFLILSAPGQAADLPEDPGAISWNLSAGTVTYDRNADVYIAEDSVVITGGKTRLEADYVEFSNTTKEVVAQGNVKLISGGDVISSNAMQVNLATETGYIEKGTIFIQKNHFYIRGEQIRKTGAFTYSAETGSITSCDGDTPDWKITGKDVRVTIEGYGFARDTTLWAKNLPALYSPFLAFPVKTQRQTGFLTPGISTSSRLGYVYEQPFFWAISPSRDATLYAGYLSDRGPKAGAEYRYVTDDVSKGIWQIDFLNDDKVDDGTFATRDYRYDSTPQRTNTDRYWLRAKTDQALPHGFFARLDLDVVSDPDYLLEFKDGMTGFDSSNQVFAGEFGRDLDEYDDDLRKNSLIIDRSWSQHALNMRALWYDNVTARRTSEEDTTLQTLPGIEFSAVRQQIGGTGLYYAMDSELTSFFRQHTVNTAAPFRTTARVNGQRLDIAPTFFYPVKLGKNVSFQPFAGFRGTAYHTDSFTDIHGEDDPFRFRGLYELGGHLTTRLNRVFTASTAFSDKIQHQVTPGVSYHFLPYVDQKDLPSFDSLDDIEETNHLTWFLTHRFIARNPIPGKDGTPVNQYRELGWIKFFQDYDLKHERDGQNAPDQPWSDIHVDARIYPFSFLSLRTDLAWSPYDYHFNTLNMNTTLTSARGDAITTAYRYTTDTNESWYTRLHIRINRELSTYYSFEKDLDRKNTIETRAGILLEKACWAMGLDFKESDLDKRFAFMITLKGIGEFSTK
jgi:LPS-assembly protein